MTVITNRPDSGAQGNNWAYDNFTRTARLRFVSAVSLSDCPGSLTGGCFLWSYQISDSGTFTAIASQLAPRAGTLDQSLTGVMHGGTTTGQFYASWKTAEPQRVPPVENDNKIVPTGIHTTTKWVEQFFGNTAVFNSLANPGGPDLGKWGWTYTLNFGTNKQCPNDAYQWVDAAPDAGSLAKDGNILTPTSAHCT